jgi:hypothetical protein
MSVLKLRVPHKAANFCMLLVTDYWILMNNVMNGFCQVTLPWLRDLGSHLCISGTDVSGLKVTYIDICDVNFVYIKCSQ